MRAPSAPQFGPERFKKGDCPGFVFSASFLFVFWFVLRGVARGLREFGFIVLGEIFDRCGTRAEAQPP